MEEFSCSDTIKACSGSTCIGIQKFFINLLFSALKIQLLSHSAQKHRVIFYWQLGIILPFAVLATKMFCQTFTRYFT